jgi:hypothetical protein
MRAVVRSFDHDASVRCLRALPGQPSYLARRVSRPHPYNEDGIQIVVPSVDMLTAAEKKCLPPRLAKLFESLPQALAEAPAPVAWMAEALRERPAVLECSRFENPEAAHLREYWHVRWSHPFEDSLATACVGCDADPAGRCPPDVPPALAWLRNTFGTFGLVAEQSGTAPFGRTLGEVAARERASSAAIQAQASLSGFPGLSTEPFDDRFANLPRGAERWISLYEADGDWVFADIEKNETRWVGSEWTGEPVTRFAVPWESAASFILSRMLDGRDVRPENLRVLEQRKH